MHTTPCSGPGQDATTGSASPVGKGSPTAGTWYRWSVQVQGSTTQTALLVGTETMAVIVDSDSRAYHRGARVRPILSAFGH
eukprot:16834-Eustigmatos_ZCMA.PRE.1